MQNHTTWAYVIYKTLKRVRLDQVTETEEKEDLPSGLVLPGRLLACPEANANTKLGSMGRGFAVKIGIVGAGKVGTAVALLLKGKGHVVMGVASRTRESAANAAFRLGCKVTDAVSLSREVETLFITTSDSAIYEVCEEIAEAEGFCAGQTVIHMSGSLTTESLEPARRRGCRVISLHPLQSCANVELALENIPGSIFSIEGDREAHPLAEQLVTEMGGQFFYIDKEAKPLYHAAACVASNYLVSLLDLSRQLMEAAGMPPGLGVEAIMPLVGGTLKNINRLGTTVSLTGPIARGDISTLQEHLQVMVGEASELLNLYAILGQYTAALAERGGKINRQQRQLLERLFSTQVEFSDNNQQDQLRKLQ